jgi:hypothetical protein
LYKFEPQQLAAAESSADSLEESFTLEFVEEAHVERARPSLSRFS